MQTVLFKQKKLDPEYLIMRHICKKCTPGKVEFQKISKNRVRGKLQNTYVHLPPAGTPLPSVRSTGSSPVQAGQPTCSISKGVFAGSVKIISSPMAFVSELLILSLSFRIT